MRTSTHFVRPLPTASIRGVASFRERPSMSALAAISSSTTLAWPSKQAIIRGESPSYCTYRVIFDGANFRNELPILIFRSLNIRTAQHNYSDVEHIDIIVQGHFRMMLFNTKYTKISTIRKLPAICHGSTLIFGVLDLCIAWR